MTAPVLRLVIGDLTPFGLRKLGYGPAVQMRHHKRIPLIDIGTVKLIKDGRLTVYPGIDSFTTKGVRFVDGPSGEF